jgi:hypothetical protein
MQYQIFFPVQIPKPYIQHYIALDIEINSEKFRISLFLYNFHIVSFTFDCYRIVSNMP